MLGLEDRMITTLGKLPKERYIDYKKSKIRFYLQKDNIACLS
jgi:hypothetical protein